VLIQLSNAGRLSSDAEVSTRPEVTAVFDVGKTNVRLSAVDDSGAALAALERENIVHNSPPYPHFDADDLFAWLVDGLRTLTRDFHVQAVVPVAHGACAALVDDAGLVLPIMDYEFRSVSDVDLEYDATARDFTHTASPKLPAGLNLGRQLFWQQKKFPEEFGRATIVPYPQYWAMRLCGIRAWESTSLGCHTDLWDVRSGDFSTFAKRMGWDVRFGHRAHAWTPLGPPLADIVASTGLSNGCRIVTGIHDSNASYLAHRASRETADEPFYVVSTGTWFVMMAHGSPLDVLREEMDMLANVDAFGEPIATARFMGGREYAAICGADGVVAQPSGADLDAMLTSGTFALPSFADEGGPFRSRTGAIVGNTPTAPRHRAALAALYCALMTDYCLTMLAARGDVIVEGRFASNAAFISALAALRAPQPVFRSRDETGSLHGALALSLLAREKIVARASVDRVRPGPADKLNAAREKWRRLLASNR